MRCQRSPIRLSTPAVHGTIVALLLTGGAPRAAATRQPFEPNRGQADVRFAFLTREDGFELLLGPTESVLRLPSKAPHADELRLSFIGAQAALIEGTEPLPGRVDYLVGAEPKRWATGIPTFAVVRYAQLYPGIDLSVRGDYRDVDYEFLLAPGANPEAIRIGVADAAAERLDAESRDLLFTMTEAEVRALRPRASQQIQGDLHELEAGYILGTKGEIGVGVAAYDTKSPLVVTIRIRRSASAFPPHQDGVRVAVDAHGAMYVTGRVVAGAGEAGDAFVSKLSADGASTLQTTYLGGDGDDVPLGITIDSEGSVLLTGRTGSTDFPLVGAMRPTIRGATDAFVSKLAPGGTTLLFSTLLGGDGDDEGRGIAAGPDGSVWVTGRTLGGGFPTTETAMQREPAGRSDAFISRLGRDGERLLYSSYLGGYDEDAGDAIGVDLQGRIHLAGTTRSSDFPVKSPLQPTLGGGAASRNADAFVATMSPDGAELEWSTFLGGSADDGAAGLDVDASGDTFVTGRTASTDFPLGSRAIQSALNRTGVQGHTDAFVAVIDPLGTSLLQATYLGGTLDDDARSIALDRRGDAWIAGTTSSADVPWIDPDAAPLPGERAIFVARLGRRRDTIANAISFHGWDCDAGVAVAVTPAGEAIVAGVDRSVGMPSALRVQPAFEGGLVTVARVIPQAASCPGTINFDNSAGTGLWQTASNWDLDRLPISTDDVCVAGFAVTLSSGTQTVNSLTVDGAGSLALSAGSLNLATTSQIDGSLTLGGSGSLDGIGRLTINGPTTWTGGSMTGTGRTTTGGGLTIGTNAVTMSGGRVLENPSGSIATMTANVGFGFGASGSVENAGVWDIQNDADFTELGGVGTRSVKNTGTFRKSGGSGVTAFGAGTSFGNTSPGSVELQSGTLALPTGTHTGSFSISAGATLQLTSATAFSAPASLSGAGSVSVTAGTSDFNTGSSYSPSGLTTISAGAMNFNAGATATPGSLALSGSGALGGAAQVTVTGPTTWTGGSMTGTGRTRTSGGLTVSINAVTLGGGRVLENPSGSTATMTANVGFGFGASGSVENGGVWDIQNNASFTELGGVGTRSVTNTGTFRKSGGTGVTAFGAATTFGNTSPGSVELQSGTLALPAGTHTGSFSISAGATLQLTNATTFNAPASVAGAGSVSLTGGTSDFNTGTNYAPVGSTAISAGTMNFNAGATATPGSLSLSGSGTLGGAAQVTVTGPTTWTGGTMTGTGRTKTSGGLSIDTNAVAMTGGRVLENPAGSTATMTANLGFGFGTSGSVENAGLWDIQNNSSFTELGGTGTRSVTNAGTFRKSGGSASTTFGAATSFSNTSPGSVEVLSGTLALPSGTHTGSFSISGGATLQLTNVTAFNAPASVAGAGSVSVTAGTADFNTGTGYSPAGSTVVTAGTMNFNAGSTPVFTQPTTVSGTLTFNTTPVILAGLSLSGMGVLGGGGQITVTGPTTWTGGTMTGTGRTTTSGGLTIGTNAVTLSGGRVLENPSGSTATMTADVGFGFTASGSVENAGVWDIQNDADFTELGGAGTRSVTNTGTFRKSGGSAATTFGSETSFGNSSPGSVEVQTGTLALPSGTHTGSFAISAGATLQLTNATTFNSPASVGGAGSVSLTAGTSDFNTGTNYSPAGSTAIGAGTMNFNAGATATSGSLSLSSGGALGGAAQVTITGPTTWTGGTMTGTGRTKTLGGLFIGTNSVTLTGGRILENPSGSTATMAADLGFGFANSSSVENAGIWDIQNNAGFTDAGGTGARTITNAGIFQKSAGTGTSSVPVAFSNTGSVLALAGVLGFTSSYTQTAGSTTLNGGAIVSSQTLSIQGGVLRGTGTVSASVSNGGQVSPGLSTAILNESGSYVQTSTGSLAIEIGGLAAGTQYDRLAVTGSAAVSGTLSATLVNGFVPADGNSFTILTFAVGTGTFATLDLPPLAPGWYWTTTYGPTSVILTAHDDTDGDGVPDLEDCAPLDPGAFAPPGPIVGDAFGADKQTYSWNSAIPTSGSATVHDVMRGALRQFPVGTGESETCLASGVSAAVVVDGTVPATGGGFYYLVRAKNVCATGTYGFATSGAERTPLVCP